MRRQRVIGFLKWCIVIILVGGIIGYSGFAAKRVFEGPGITLLSPTSGAILDTSLVDIAGSTRNAASLTLNGRLIPVDTTGRFREQLLLSYGYNIIELVATDRAGKTIKKTVTLFYQ